MSVYGVKLRRSDDLTLERHPAGCTLETFESWCSERVSRGERLAIDLFSGAGGLSLGIEQAGWTVAASVDSDVKALQTHRHNFAGLALPCDLSDSNQLEELIDLFKAVPVDLVAGGPPCQPFSRAGRSKIKSLVEEGRRSANDLRRHLWQAFVKVAASLRPRVVLMENVPDMALGDDFKTVRQIALELEQAGYETEISLVDAWRFGVPQHRKRLILLARRDNARFTWPAPEPTQNTLWDAIGDLPPIDTANDDIGSRSMPYNLTTNSLFTSKMRKGMKAPVVWDHMTRPVRNDDREIFSQMTPDMLYKEIPDHLRRYSADTFDDKYNKLAWKELCRTITAHIAKDGYWYIHPDQPRTLSVREAARVQTFPDRFRFAGTRSDAFRQIGNAVPPMLGLAAATALAPATEQAPGSSPSKLIAIHEDLEAWARSEPVAESRYLLPGPHMTIPVALLVSLLEGKRAAIPSLTRAIGTLGGKDFIGTTDLKALQQHLTSPAGKKALDLLRPLTRKRHIWDDMEQVSREAGLKPAQAQFFRILCGDDVLMTSQSVLRVAARVAGTQSHKVNRLTDGKVSVARLMGHPKDSSLRVAALRLIGTTICREQRHLCASCPLVQHCATAQKTETNQPTLFTPV